MARMTISITHVAWRDGRPRFNPGPRLRDLGFKGKDLKTPAATWMTAKQAFAWSAAFEIEAAARAAEVAKAKVAKRKVTPVRPSAAAAGRYVSVEDLFELFWRSPQMAGETVVDGKRRQKPRSPKTVRDYKIKAKLLGEFDGTLWTAPVEGITKPMMFDLYERLWAAKGLAMARGTLAVLSAAISWAIKRGRIKLAYNPCLGLGMEMPEPRLRALTPPEVKHLVAAADAIGRPEVGDAITLGVWTGQRQGDRLRLEDGGLVDGRRIFKQGKTGAIVAIPSTPELDVRLAAARSRRASWKIMPAEVVVDEQVRLRAGSQRDPNEVRRQPFRADHYRHVFAGVRKAAAIGMPSLADITDQDLRDTAVTWLARAACTVPEICAITGHSAASAHSILKHYLASHPELADNAIRKLVAWFEGQQVHG